MRKKAYDSETGTKRCSTCRRRLPVSEFYPSKKQPGGVQGVCKKCSRRGVLEWQIRNVDRTNAKNKRWKKKHHAEVLSAGAIYREENREKIRKWNRDYARRRRAQLSAREVSLINRRQDLRRKYGLSVEAYDAMLIAQDGRCAICGAPASDKRALAVDHDHRTGKNRGLLCGHCNPLLHKLEADANWLRKAIEYLRRE